MNAACSTTILSIVLLAIAFHTSILLYIRAIFIFTFYSCDKNHAIRKVFVFSDSACRESGD